MACHVPPCPRRYSAVPFLHIAPPSRPVPFAPPPARFPGAAEPFSARIACARACAWPRALRGGAVRAPDCARAREANAGHTSPLRFPGIFLRRRQRGRNRRRRCASRCNGSWAPQAPREPAAPRPAPRSRRQCHGLSCCVIGRRAAPASGFAVRETPRSVSWSVMFCHVPPCPRRYAAVPFRLRRRPPGFPARRNPFPRVSRVRAPAPGRARFAAARVSRA